jgi:hypothetical protein
MSDVKGSDLGFFGNIWVRQNILEKTGDATQGHKHSFDHVSLLATGSVEVEITGYPPKQFKAPTFIIIRKDFEHKFTALEDNSNWYCVFAMRDVDGNVMDIFGEQHDPITEFKE